MKNLFIDAGLILAGGFALYLFALGAYTLPEVLGWV